MSKLRKYVNRKGESFPHLYQDVDTLEFWVIATIRNKKKTKSLKTKDYAEAIGKVSDALKDLGKEPDKVVTRVATNKLVESFWQDLRKEKVDEEIAPATLQRMDQVWEYDLKSYWGKKAPHTIKASDAADFIEWRRKARPDVQFYNAFKYLNNLMTYMIRVGVIHISQRPRLVVPKAEALHHEKKKGRVITPEEFQRLARSASNERIELLMRLTYLLGMRQMEMGKLEKERLVWRGDRLVIVLDNDDTKTGIAREIPVPLDLTERLWAFAERAESKYVFPASRTSLDKHVSAKVIFAEWKKTKEAARIRGKMRFHDFRGTAATNMAAAGVNPIIAVTILGMSFRTYQKKYLNLTAKDLILVVDQLSGVRSGQNESSQGVNL